jgi:CBS domain-containing protein
MERVIYWMHWPVISLAEYATVGLARELLARYEIGRLPILGDGAQLTGIIATADVAHGDTEALVRDHMTRDVATVSPMEPIADAAAILEDLGVGGLPVTIDDYVLGMITWHDLQDADLAGDELMQCLLCGSGHQVRLAPDFFDIPRCARCTQLAGLQPGGAIERTVA